MAIADPPRVTAADLLAMPDAEGYELVNGHLAEKTMGARASWVGGRLFARIDAWNEGVDAGLPFPAEAGYQCFAAEADRVRKPDVSFVVKGRLPNDEAPDGFIRIPPD